MRGLLILLALLTFSLNAQCRIYCGAVLPLRRSFVGAEAFKRFDQISIGLSGEVGRMESNISPKLNLHLKKIRLEGGMGWGHRFEKECSDHNYHTYTLGVVYERKRLFFGSSMFWRSYQAHIGLHRGTLRFVVGMNL